MNLTNIDCMGQNDLCEVVFTNNFKTPIQNTENCKTGDYKEPVYIEADNEFHGRKSDRELFCVTGNDSGYIDIDDLY